MIPDIRVGLRETVPISHKDARRLLLMTISLPVESAQIPMNRVSFLALIIDGTYPGWPAYHRDSAAISISDGAVR